MLRAFRRDNPMFSQLVMQVGQGDSLLQFLEADRRTALGLDESGPLHMLAWDGAVEVGVPFSGDDAQAELLSSLSFSDAREIIIYFALYPFTST